MPKTTAIRTSGIFSATKRNADRLAKELYNQGHAAAALHGDMNQNARNRTIINMRRGKIKLLVATDVAARGLDVSGITHVINYDLPNNADDAAGAVVRRVNSPRRKTPSNGPANTLITANSQDSTWPDPATTTATAIDAMPKAMITGRASRNSSA